ncbi:MAG: hypothetical protein ACRDKB_12940 [Actinomycetota bacterium]
MRRLIAVPLLLALTLGACSDSGTSDPREAFERALENLADAPGVTMALSLRSTVEDLRALADSSGDALSAESASKILDSSLTVSATQSADPADSEAVIVLEIAGRDALELRTIGFDFFVRVDIDTLAALFGQDAAELRAEAQNSADFGLSFIDPLLAGEWIALKGLERFASMGAAQAEQGEEFVRRITDALKASVEVTAAGEDAIGTHLLARVPLGVLLQEILRAAEDLTGGLGGLGAGAVPPDSLPKGDLEIELWVDDDELRQVEVDLIQFGRLLEEEVPRDVDEFSLLATIAEFGGGVEAPSGAVEVDVQELFGAMFGCAAATESIEVELEEKDPYEIGVKRLGPRSDFPCRFLKGEPRAVLRQYAAECPHLLND